jgi:hypothetical protein
MPHRAVFWRFPGVGSFHTEDPVKARIRIFGDAPNTVELLVILIARGVLQDLTLGLDTVKFLGHGIASTISNVQSLDHGPPPGLVLSVP